jgi:hypothetical protein
MILRPGASQYGDGLARRVVSSGVEGQQDGSSPLPGWLLLLVLRAVYEKKPLTMAFFS